jgi:hypothetical protein
MYLKRKNMEVVQPDEGGVYEVAATIENLFEFFENFFPKIDFSQGKTNLEKLQLIFGALSCFDYKLEVTNFNEFEHFSSNYNNKEHNWTIVVNG